MVRLPHHAARLEMRLVLLSVAAFAASIASAFPIFGPRPDIPVVEYYNVFLDHYFLTATPDEMDAIEHGSAGPGWVRTGWTFGAYPPDATNPDGYSGCSGDGSCGTPVSRFYGKPGGPNSHFYTADPAEAAGLMTPSSQWAFERVEFRVDVPNGKDGAGNCAAGLVPVYRLYNNGFALGIDGNHRYVTDAGERAKMRAKGWLDEGVRFCAYDASLQPVKSYVMSRSPIAVMPSAQCEDESINRGPCVAVNNLPTPSTKLALPQVSDSSPFAAITGTHSSSVWVSNVNAPASSEFVQTDAVIVAGTGIPALFGIHVDSSKRFQGDLCSINPLYQFHTTVDPGKFDDRFFPWTGYESPTELRVSFTLNVKTITAASGSAAYGHPTLEFIDTKSGHHLYFTVGTYGSMPAGGSDLLMVDSGTGKVIVGTTFRAGTPYGRSLGLPTLYTPSGFVSPNSWGWGGYFEFRVNRDEFQQVLNDGRKLDTTLSASPDDYILDNFHFNNEVSKDGEIGINLANYRVEVLKR
jgi:hypothetical protein